MPGCEPGCDRCGLPWSEHQGIYIEYYCETCGAVCCMLQTFVMGSDEERHHDLLTGGGHCGPMRLPKYRPLEDRAGAAGRTLQNEVAKAMTREIDREIMQVYTGPSPRQDDDA